MPACLHAMPVQDGTEGYRMVRYSGFTWYCLYDVCMTACERACCDVLYCTTLYLERRYFLPRNHVVTRATRAGRMRNESWYTCLLDSFSVLRASSHFLLVLFCFRFTLLYLALLYLSLLCSAPLRSAALLRPLYSSCRYRMIALIPDPPPLPSPCDG